MSPDLVRMFNVLLASVDLVLLAWMVRLLWDEISPPRRAMWVGCGALLLSIAYGSVEVQYLTSDLRLGMVAFSLSMFGTGFAAEIRDARRRR